MSALLPLQAIIDQLEKAHGRPGKPRVTRPLELILWENVVLRKFADRGYEDEIVTMVVKILERNTVSES